jgi:uncharacterized repeat protein (TIGR01451 family)
MSIRSWMAKLGFPILALLLALCFSGVAQAATTYNVNSSADTDTAGDEAACANGTAGCTLRAAIVDANGDGAESVVNVPADRYDRDPLNSDYTVANDGPLTIQGTSGDPKDQIISADGYDRVFNVETDAALTLKNVTVQDGFTGNGECNGAGVQVNDGDQNTTSLTLDNSRVIKNVEICSDNGGGIWAGSQTSVTVTNSHVDDNNTYGAGGGIWYEGDLTLTDSTVDGNTSTNNDGGGISDRGTSLVATGSDISGNVAADDEGGGIYHGFSGSDIQLTDTTVDNNVASNGNGGGIYSDSGVLRVTRGSVSSNKSFEDGGGIYQEGDGLAATDVTIDNNWAQFDGGGVDNDSGLASFSGGTVDGNFAKGIILFPILSFGGGGGIYNDGSDGSGAGLTVDGTDVSNNQAGGSDGGGILNDSGSLTVSNATLNANKAGSETFCDLYEYFCSDAQTRGGGIYNGGDDATVTDTEVNDNYAEQQGGGIYNEGGNLTVERTTVDRNLATNSIQLELLSTGGAGGGIFNAANALSLTDSHVDDNRATDESGGGVYHSGSGDLTVTRTSVDGNFTAGDGGGVYNAGAPDQIADSSVSKNIADSNGAGIFETAQGQVVVTARPHADSIVGSNISNSTIANNQADVQNNGNNGGGIYNDRGDGMTLSNVTLAGNLANYGDGGGIFTTDGNTATLVNTIVADNQANGPDASNCGGANSPAANYTSGGDNVENTGNQDPTGTDCNLADGTGGDRVVGDVKLGPLQDNGGPTLTRALLDGSVALDKVTDNTCPPPDHDQRQAHRPVNGACDSGAYEGYSLADLAITKAGPASVTTGGNVSYTLHVTNNGPDKILAVHVHDALPGGVTLVSATPSQGTCGGSVDCDLGALADGATATITVVVTAPGSPTTLTNTATVSGAPTETDTSNNSASVRTQVTAPGTTVQQQGPQGTQPQVQPGPQACLKTPPRTSISLNGLIAASDTLRFVGRSIDLRCLLSGQLGIKKVQIAVGLDVGSGKCRFLAKDGTLGPERSCKRPQYLTARRGKIRNGKVPWTFRMRHLNLPHGNYLVIALGTDTNNDRETKLRKYNRKTFTIGH